MHMYWNYLTNVYLHLSLNITVLEPTYSSMSLYNLNKSLIIIHLTVYAVTEVSIRIY